VNRVTVFAPASVGNVGVGFDILGHALDTIGDRVTVERSEEPGVRIAGIEGAGNLPLDSARNAATAGILRLIEDRKLPFGFEITIEKGIPMGSGMGGSAASAVGAMVATSALLPEPLTPEETFAYALVGETVASGAAHGDNLAPCLLGGMVLVRLLEPVDAVSIPVPDTIRCVVVHPQLRVFTRAAREILPCDVSRRSHVEQSANLAGFLAGCYASDLDLIARSLSDVLIEPHRKTLVPGFCAVQRAAREGGALGCSLSGSGPTLFAWCGDGGSAEEVRARMIAAFDTEGIAARGWISRVSGVRGAHVVEAR
jgi:homoserine kinase